MTLRISPLFGFAFICILPAKGIGSASKLDTGYFSMFGSNISWKNTGDIFEIKGLKSDETIRLKFPSGKEKSYPVTQVQKLDGSIWETVALYRQIQANTQSETQVLEKKSSEHLKTVRLDPNDTQSWSTISQIPVAVRTQLRKPLRIFVRNNYSKILKSFRTTLGKRKRKDLAPFLSCLVFPKGKTETMNPKILLKHFREDFFEPCFALISPSTNLLGDSLVNKELPTPLEKKYFAYNDEASPKWSKSTLFLVHTSQDFHHPFVMKDDLERRVAQFRKNKNPVVFLVHNDQFHDASYVVRPQQVDLTFFTETGQHPLCENCEEASFAGGYIDYCLGLAARSYIANYFRDRNAGEVRLNFLADSIYVETDSGPDSMGGNTALMEINKDGIQNFVEKRLGQYLTSSLSKDAARKICPIDNSADPKCQEFARQAGLADVRTQDKDGRQFPRLEDSRFFIRIQVDGQDYAYPIGDISSPKKVILNVVTQ